MNKRIETVTIPKKEYDELLRNQAKLSALIAGGVDNWEGYSFALEEYYELEEET